MGSNQQTVSRGLYFIFIGAIVSIFAGIPFLGIIVLAAGSGISIYGLYTIRDAHPYYKNAFIVEIVTFILAVIGVISKGNVIVTVANYVLSFLMVYFVSKGTQDMLRGVSSKLIARGELIWKLYAVCTCILVVVSLLAKIPLLLILSGLIAVIAGIVGIVASILYFIFIYQSYKALA